MSSSSSSSSAKRERDAAAEDQPAAKRAAAPSAKKLWGGAFSKAPDKLFEEFNESLSFDRVMWREDLDGSKAYASAIARAGVITEAEAAELRAGLDRVAAEWEAGTFEARPGDEDIHTANERRLTELIGPVAGKLHTGRSRNSQVATDLRLWLAKEVKALRAMLGALIASAASRAERDIDLLMPGYTHLQPAQPVRWSHLLLSHAAAWHQDAERLDDLVKRVLILPLGSGALAGHPFGIDRDALAKDLGFPRVSMNSLFSVCDRDFVAEFLFVSSMTMLHISQWAEDLINLCSRKFVVCGEEYSTGSSLMPQKKNPDALELLRGKSGRVVGALVGLVTVLKSLPRAYNKDLQEDKEGLFDVVRTMRGCLPIATGVMDTLVPNREGLASGLVPEMLATDLADYLVRRGVPFRETHHVAGAAVKLAETKGVPLSALTADDLRTLHDKFGDDVAEVWSYERSVETRSVPGGTSRSSVEGQIKFLREWLAASKDE